jgi:hypothetical protein
MAQSIPIDGPINLAALDDFLASDRAPPGCMQVSEFDGFLTGIDKANLPLDENERLPDAEMAKLLADTDQILGMCVSGMRAFFQRRRRQPARKGASHARRKRHG